jgi:drug/metabolite transporter (DMT)-like permease
MDLQLIGICAALLSAFAWAGGAILYKKIGERASSSGLNLVKSVLSLLLLASALIISGIEDIETETFLLLFVSGFIGISIGDTLFFESLQKIGAHLLVLLSLLGQVLTVFFAVIFLGEVLTLNMSIGIAMVISGIAIVLYAKISNEEKKKNSIKGVIYGLLSVICMSISIIIAKKGLASVSALQATFIRILAGTFGLFIWGLASGNLRTMASPFKERALLKKIFTAVCIVTLGGFWLYHVALKYTDVVIASTLNATEPLFVIPLAALFLKERITFGVVIGTIISVCGIIILISW